MKIIERFFCVVVWLEWEHNNNYTTNLKETLRDKLKTLHMTYFNYYIHFVG
jgi:hypothetical protein